MAASHLGSRTAERTERGTGETSVEGAVDATWAYHGFGLKIPDFTRVTIRRTGGEKGASVARSGGDGEGSCEPFELDRMAHLEPGNDGEVMLDEVDGSGEAAS
jgi:hypothetical protein